MPEGDKITAVGCRELPADYLLLVLKPAELLGLSGCGELRGLARASR